VPLSSITLDSTNKYGSEENEKQGHLSWLVDSYADTSLHVQIDNANQQIIIRAAATSTTSGFSATRTLHITAYPKIKLNTGKELCNKITLSIDLTKGNKWAQSEWRFVGINLDTDDIKRYFNQYSLYS
jgi:hypothetical protein